MPPPLLRPLLHSQVPSISHGLGSLNRTGSAQHALKRWHPSQSHRCIPRQPLSPCMDSVHCKHIPPSCSNNLCTTHNVRVLVQHMLRKRLHKRRRRHIESNSTNLARNKPSVLWKRHSLIPHAECLHTQCHHQLESIAELAHKVFVAKFTNGYVNHQFRLHGCVVWTFPCPW